jgi:hypothetical protein
MAVAWPRELPREVRTNELRAAECKVYDKLREVLDDEFMVFYSRPWLGLKSDGSEIDGECDFVVANANLGILAIEVKGGAIGHDPATDRWTSRDRGGYLHYIKNPVGQARSAKHQIVEKLRASPKWRSRWVRACHGVIFPDSRGPGRDLGLDMPRRIFCCLEEFENGLHDWIVSRFADQDVGRTPEGLGRDGVAAIEDILARPFQLRMPIGHVAAEADRELQILTTQQYHILSALGDVKRAAVAGGAGTGKTVLAMEKAIRCADAGTRTLLTCFNAPLAAEMTRRLSSRPSIDVMSFHALCTRMAEAAGLEIPDGARTQEFFDGALPELLMKAAEVRPELRYSAIIVDEGQDFQVYWWPAVEALLSREGPGCLYVFFDNNQRVYAGIRSLPTDLELVPIRLSRNLRNTRRIHEVARAHYSGSRIESDGPEGSHAEWLDEGRGGPSGALAQCLARLVGQERVAPEDIAVLFANEREISAACRNNRVGGLAWLRCDSPASGCVTVDTVRRFKGLERRIVIVVATDAMTADQELRYLSLSRPRAHLIVIGSQRNLDLMKGGDAGSPADKGSMEGRP